MTSAPTPSDRPLPPPPPQVICCPPKRSWFSRIGMGILVALFVLSIVLNIELIVLAGARSQKGFESTTLRDGEKDQEVAVYNVQGMIDDEAAQRLERFYRLVEEDKNIKAVVLRVESPGGTVAASDQMHHTLVRMQKELKKKVVVSMGGVAASGGYYISASADAIYAEPTTATGSIGVIAMWPVLKGLMDKVGVDMVTIRSDDSRTWKARENPFEAPDDRVRQEVLEMLNTMQQRFSAVVKEGRGEKLVVKPQADGADGGPAPLNGKVYLAQEAKALGLVDQIGYQQDAADEAARLAKLGNPRIVSYTRHKGLFESAFGAKASAPIVVDSQALDQLGTPRIMMLWKVQ
jgi:protease-4